MAVLSDGEVTTALGELDGWERAGDEMVKTYELASFPAAIAFVTRVGFLAEKADHHPDLDIRWRKVKVALSSHDAGGITAKDFALANDIENVAAGEG